MQDLFGKDYVVEDHKKEIELRSLFSALFT
jgi:hypothetical protein